MREKYLTDGHMERNTLEKILGVRLVNAKERKPRFPYKGPLPHIEDHSHVLQRTYEEVTLLITSDRGMIPHAFEFAKQYPKFKKDKCLRGIVVLPNGNQERATMVKRFLNGELDIISPRGIAAPTTFEEVFDYNLGLDLTLRHPKAIELCACPVNK